MVVDEEHEPAYKQDETPRYHGRDVAVYRAKLAGALCLLGSATPSLESFRQCGGRASTACSTRSRKRVDAKPVARTSRSLSTSGSRSCGQAASPARALAASWSDAHPRSASNAEGADRSSSSIAAAILRRACSAGNVRPRRGAVRTAVCAMTFHRTDDTLKLSPLRPPARPRRPSCTVSARAPDIRWRGLGTQRVEEAVRRVAAAGPASSGWTRIRWRGRHRFREVLGRVPGGASIDILIGTQMIGKGLDFPERHPRGVGGRRHLDARAGLSAQTNARSSCSCRWRVGRGGATVRARLSSKPSRLRPRRCSSAQARGLRLGSPRPS